jgi:hypothetical protein
VSAGCGRVLGLFFGVAAFPQHRGRGVTSAACALQDRPPAEVVAASRCCSEWQGRVWLVVGSAVPGEWFIGELVFGRVRVSAGR